MFLDDSAEHKMYGWSNKCRENCLDLSALWITIQFIIQLEILLRTKTVVIIIPDNSCKMDCAGHLVSLIIQKKNKNKKEEEGKRETEQKYKNNMTCKIYYFMSIMTSLCIWSPLLSTPQTSDFRSYASYVGAIIRLNWIWMKCIDWSSK